MCAGALVAARIERLVFGARDLRFGGVRSKFQMADSTVLNHRVEVVEGVLAVECVELLREFLRGSAPQIGVVARNPVFAARRENVGHHRVFQCHHAVRHIGRDHQALARAHHLSRRRCGTAASPVSTLATCSLMWLCSGTTASFWMLSRAIVICPV